jgi:hypothetical protein
LLRKTFASLHPMKIETARNLEGNKENIASFKAMVCQSF